MTTPSLPVPRRRGRAVLLVAAGLLIVGGLYAWERATRPALPALDLREADPAVVQAVQAARAEVQRSPRSGPAFGRLGMVLLAHGLEGPAAACFAQAERLEPAEPRWPYLRGQAVRTTDPPLALAELERAVRLGGTHPPAPGLALAELYLEQGQLDDAEGLLRRLIGQGPDDGRVSLDLGRLTCLRNQLGASVSHLERATRSSQARRAAHGLLAEVRRRQGDLDGAAREQARAAGLPPDAPSADPYLEEVHALVVGKDALLKRLRALREQGRLGAARALAGRIEQAHPEVYWLVEGRVRLQRGRLPEAEQALREAVRLDPASVDALLDLAAVQLRRGDPQAAATSYRQALAVQPDHGPAHQGLARCQRAAGDRKAAMRSLQAALRSMPQDATARRELGELLAEEGRHAEAVVQLRHAVHLAPSDERARQRLEEEVRAARGGRPAGE